jgi:hypothetical protein
MVLDLYFCQLSRSTEPESYVIAESRMNGSIKTEAILSRPFVVEASAEAPQASPRSVADWLADIKRTFVRGKTSTLELAKLVSAAKCELRFGQWAELCRSGALPFSKRKAEILVAIGKGLGHLNAQNSAHLPSAWSALYYLSKLDRTRLANLITQGAIHPGLTIREAKALLGTSQSKNCGADREVQLRRRLDTLRKFIRTTLHDWSSEEREMARRSFLQLAAEVAAHGNAALQEGGLGLKHAVAPPRTFPSRSDCGSSRSSSSSLKISQIRA